VPKAKSKIPNKDTIQVVISDTHSGSNFALFLGKQWQGQYTSHVPSAAQVEIRKHFIRFAKEVAEARTGKAVRLIINGDSIDGNHHQSGDVCTLDETEQADIHIELMNEFETLIDWQAGDEIYYTKGTQSHTHNQENYIGREMNAVMCGDFYSWDFLPIETNGVLSWFVHHGPGAGMGANEGNTMRNWMKSIQLDASKDGKRPPDILYTGHVHQPTYSSFVYRIGMIFKTIHGIILPSWQNKTRYAYMRSPVSVNKVGGVYQVITADGVIGVPRFCIMGYE